MAQKYFACRCFYTNNFYIKTLKKHVIYKDKAQFTSDYKEIIPDSSCIDDILNELAAEKERRLSIGKTSEQRRILIASQYKPLHPHLYNIQESFLQPEFLELVKYAGGKDATAEGLMGKMSTVSEREQIYSLPVFTTEFCYELVEELQHFEQSDMPKGRPNTMNNYGILLDELGFDENLINPLRKKYLTPLTSLLFPDVGGDSLDSHKAFVVTYKMGQDTALNYHYDNAEVTINICLNDSFEEGPLYFGKMRTEPQSESAMIGYDHQFGVGVFHRGQHMHGALAITEGERYNLVIWLRSSVVRNTLCPMCDQEPELVGTLGRGDGFTEDTVDVCTAL